MPKCQCPNMIWVGGMEICIFDSIFGIAEEDSSFDYPSIFMRIEFYLKKMLCVLTLRLYHLVSVILLW